jgi:hypothetical protein
MWILGIKTPHVKILDPIFSIDVVQGTALATFSPFLAGRYFHNDATKEFGEPSAKLTPTTASFPATS